MQMLSKVKKGSRVRVHSFKSDLGPKSLIVGIGILPGDEIDLVSESFLGSPLTIRLCDGETIAMRTNEASHIIVEVIIK